MGSQWTKDKVYTKAVKAGYRSRAAYKLLEINKRFSVIRRDDNVIDLGSSPGSWLQVLREMTDGRVAGIDLNPVAPVQGVSIYRGDFTDKMMQERICSGFDLVNVVVCDASPKLSGQSSYDQARAIELGEKALDFATGVLKKGGNFVVKSFQGELFPELMERCRNDFYSVKAYRVSASRRGSSEVYIIAKNFKGVNEE